MANYKQKYPSIMKERRKPMLNMKLYNKGWDLEIIVLKAVSLSHTKYLLHHHILNIQHLI